MLNQTHSLLQKTRYSLSKVVDNGDFHRVIEIRHDQSFALMADIPVCCRVNLNNSLPPLILSFVGSKAAEQ